MKNNTILKLHTYICRVEFLLYFCMKKREKLGAMVAVITLLWGMELYKNKK